MLDIFYVQSLEVHGAFPLSQNYLSQMNIIMKAIKVSNIRHL